MTKLILKSPWGEMRAVMFEEGPDPDGKMHKVIQCVEKDICVSAFTDEEARKRLDLTMEVDAALEKYHGTAIDAAPQRFADMWAAI